MTSFICPLALSVVMSLHSSTPANPKVFVGEAARYYTAPGVGVGYDSYRLEVVSIQPKKNSFYYRSWVRGSDDKKWRVKQKLKKAKLNELCFEGKYMEEWRKKLAKAK